MWLHLLNKVLFIFLVGTKKRQQEDSYICIKQRKKEHKYMIVLEKVSESFGWMKR